MAGLKQIKTKIRAVQKTRTVTKAMEAVSAAKMRKSQQRALSARAYARAASAVLARVSGSRELAQHPLATARKVERALYIVITADRGLAGGLNSAVLRSTLRDITETGLGPGTARIFAIGRKAQDFFALRGYKVERYYPNVDISEARVREIVDEAALRYVLDGVADEGVDLVKIAYQNFVSTFEQRPTIRTVFPLSTEELVRVVSDILPVRGAFAVQEQNHKTIPSYTIEPSEDEVLGVLLPRLASVFIFHALLESQASEHSARMVAMKSASDKARDLSHALTLQFNKVRQAAITREVSEIIAGTL